MRPNLTLITNPQKPKDSQKNGNPEPVKDILSDWFKMTEKKYESALVPAGIHSFYLGHKIHQSIKPGMVSFLFSAPKMGATAILLKIVEEYNEGGYPILYVNPEMERTEFITRLAASCTGFPLSTLRGASFNEDDWAKLTVFADSINQEFIYFLNGYQVDDLDLKWNRELWLNKNTERGLFVFDNYLDMESLDGNSIQVEGAKLQKIASECDVPIIATVRLSSMDDFYQRLKPCTGSLLFDELEKMGAILSLNAVGQKKYVHFLSKKRQVSGYARIELQRDSGSIRYVY